MANLFVAYVLWWFVGWLGVHHFYLGRDKHAFIWWATLGGCFGVGWLRDLCRLSDYVEEANNTQAYRREFEERKKYRKAPSFNIFRFIGEAVVGMLFGFLVTTAFSLDWLEVNPIPNYIISIVLVPIGVAVGVWVVSNIGSRVNGNFKLALYGAYIAAIPLAVWKCYTPNDTETGSSLSNIALAAAITLNWKGKTWQTQPKVKQGLCKRLTVLGLCGMLYLSLWTSGIYFNASITTQDGEQIKIRDAVENFLKSQAWTDTKSTFSQLYHYYQQHGFNKIWEQLVIQLDPEGEANAYKVLELDSNATQDQISAKYKKLVRQWHPDKNKDENRKEEFAKKFMEIQKAYETLSNIKTRRTRKNYRKDRDYDRASEF